MPIRPLRLPQDLTPAAQMLARTFQYPEHPEWGVQSDEQEQLTAALRRIRRIWPVIRGLQLLSPALRDLMRGFVAEEDGAMVGMTVAQREGTTTTWYIGTVGVLPEFRGRGIARELVEATLAMIRSRGGTRVRLGVIDGNAPAQSLYRSLGFAEYASSTRYTLTPRDPIERLPLPAGMEEAPLREFDWRTRYELDRRIVPAEIQGFDPIAPGKYKAPLPVRVFAILFRFAESTRERDLVLRSKADRTVVARGGWSVVKRGSGMNSIRVRLDPAHADLAPYLARRALSEVVRRSPHLRVDLFVPSWMPSVAAEALSLGFVRRTSNKSMGLTL